MKLRKKLLAVVMHEYRTIIRQKAFWIALLAVPGFIVLSFGISYLSDQRQQEGITKNQQNLEITVLDNSGFVNEELARNANVKLTETTDAQVLVGSVKSGELDGLIVYPSNISESQSYQVYVNQDTDDRESVEDVSAITSGLASYLLQQSLLSPIGSPEVISLATGNASAEVVAFEDGQETGGIAENIMPGAFLVLFYVVFFMSVGYAMTSVSEEKENRAIEMVLSYIHPRTLIVGKLLSVTLVALTQLAFYAAFGVAAYFAAQALGSDLSLPLDLSDIVFELQPIVFGLLYLIFGFLLFVSLMLATGAAFPSAKEANGFITFFYMLVFAPYIAAETVINMPDALITQVATYFPLTSAPTLLLRNTVGNISLVESLIGLAILMVSTVAAVWLASRLFSLGALNFSSRVKIASIFKKS